MTRTGIRRLGAVPTATGSLSRLAYAHARAAGLELKSILKEAGFTGRQLEDRTLRLTVHQQIIFLNVVADALGDDVLGFHLACRAELRELGLIYYVAASSETLDDALRRTARYTSIVNEGLHVRYHPGKEARIVFGYVDVARHRDRHQMEFCMTIALRLCRHLSGLRLVPDRLRVTHHRHRSDEEFAAYFGTGIEFGGHMDEIAFPGKVRNCPITTADRYLNALLVRHGEEALSRRSIKRGSFRSEIENAIAPLLPHGRAQLTELAGRLGLSQRTLVRRLAAEGVTFSGTLEALRADLARHYLADRDLSISRIAWLLGYRESSAFSHAFKRWTGKTPRQARTTARFKR